MTIAAGSSTEELIAHDVVNWFRDAHAKLLNLSIEQIRMLSDKIALNHRFYQSPGFKTDPKMHKYAEAWENAARLAVRLREAIEEVNLRALDLGAERGQFINVILAIDAESDLIPVRSRLPGRPRQRWTSVVATYANEIEGILRNNGFPRASISSGAGPAAWVAAQLVQYEYGIQVTPATVAREWGALKAKKRQQLEETRGKPAT